MDLLRESYVKTRCYGNGSYLNEARKWPSFRQLKDSVELQSLRISEIEYALRDNCKEIIGVQVILSDGQQSDLLGAYQHQPVHKAIFPVDRDICKIQVDHKEGQCVYMIKFLDQHGELIAQIGSFKKLGL
jgi:hypothetical protein